MHSVRKLILLAGDIDPSDPLLSSFKYFEWRKKGLSGGSSYEVCCFICIMFANTLICSVRYTLLSPWQFSRSCTFPSTLFIFDRWPWYFKPAWHCSLSPDFSHFDELPSALSTELCRFLDPTSVVDFDFEQKCLQIFIHMIISLLPWYSSYMLWMSSSSVMENCLPLTPWPRWMYPNRKSAPSSNSACGKVWCKLVFEIAYIWEPSMMSHFLIT